MPEIMPDFDKIKFKDKFVERYSKLTDFESFKLYSLSWLRRSIRVNTIKIGIDELKERLSPAWELTPIPWCKEGFWIEHKGVGAEKRRDVGNLTEHALGYIYIQEAASMIPPLILDPQPHETVLDMCASPGSKTTQIAMYMKNTGVLIANDYQGLRLKPLGVNVQRCGITNIMVTLMTGTKIKGTEFDRILVDAPCSGTGAIRKSIKTLLIWNPEMIKRLAHQQKNLICSAFDILKTGGTMVYSTCSVEPQEDEAIVSYLLENRPNAVIEDIELDVKRSPPIMEFEGQIFHPEVKKCLRLWPQDNDTEGFFVAKIRKG